MTSLNRYFTVLLLLVTIFLILDDLLVRYYIIYPSHSLSLLFYLSPLISQSLSTSPLPPPYYTTLSHLTFSTLLSLPYFLYLTFSTLLSLPYFLYLTFSTLLSLPYFLHFTFSLSLLPSPPTLSYLIYSTSPPPPSLSSPLLHTLSPLLHTLSPSTFSLSLPPFSSSSS